MSVLMETESINWSAENVLAEDNDPRNAIEIELESRVRNSDQRNLVAPLREMHTAQSELPTPADGSEAKRRAALALQENWEASLVKRELLRNDLKRGKELLEQTERELTRLRQQLEDWPAYERICGRNPLLDYMQAIAGQERIASFLPGWLQRREAQLKVLSQSLEQCARQNGLEHLL